MHVMLDTSIRVVGTLYKLLIFFFNGEGKDSKRVDSPFQTYAKKIKVKIYRHMYLWISNALMSKTEHRKKQINNTSGL